MKILTKKILRSQSRNYKKQQESDRENDEREIEDVDAKLSSLSHNEDLFGYITTDGSSVRQQRQVSSRDCTIWNKKILVLQDPIKEEILSVQNQALIERFILACKW